MLRSRWGREMLVPSETSFLIAPRGWWWRELGDALAAQGWHVLPIDTRADAPAWAPLTSDQLRHLRPAVVLVRFGRPALESLLRDLGHHVVVVDDERRLEPGDRTADPAREGGIIDQLEALVGPLDGLHRRDDRAAYEAGGLAGLARLHLGVEKPRKYWPRLRTCELVGTPGKPIDEKTSRQQEDAELKKFWAVADSEEVRRRALALWSPDDASHQPHPDAEAFFEDFDENQLSTFTTGRVPNACDERVEECDEVDDPLFVLAKVPRGGARAFAVPDAVAVHLEKTRGRPLTEPIDVLTLVADGDGGIASLEFLGHARHRAVIDDLMDGRVEGRLLDGLTCFATTSAEIVRFRAQRLDAEAREKLDELADWLLNQTLVALRPAAAARITGRVAFHMGEDQRERFQSLRRRAIDKFCPRHHRSPVPSPGKDTAYLFAYLRELLDPPPAKVRGFAEAPDRLDRLLVSVPLEREPLSCRVRRGNATRSFELEIDDLRLHFAYLECLVLEWSVHLVPQPKPTDDPPSGRRLWRELVAQPDGDRLTLAEIVDLENALQWLFSTFVTQPGESLGKRVLHQLVDEETKTPITHQVWGGAVEHAALEGWVGALLHRALRQLDPGWSHGDAAQLEVLNDNRAWLQTSIALVGDEPVHAAAREELTALLARLRMADAYGNGFAYGPEFARGELAEGSYTRFDGQGSRFLVADHAFAYVGFGDYALQPIHEVQMPQLYGRMWLVALVYLAVVRAFHTRVTRSLEGWPPGPGEIELPADYRTLERRLLVFTNTLWFHELTGQIQGVQLFAKMREQTRVESEFDLLNAEIAQLNQHVESVTERAGERRLRLLTQLGIPVAAFTGFLALAPANLKPAATPLWDWLGWAAPWITPGGMALAVAAAVAWVLAFVFPAERRRAWRPPLFPAPASVLLAAVGYGLVSWRVAAAGGDCPAPAGEVWLLALAAAVAWGAFGSIALKFAAEARQVRRLPWRDLWVPLGFAGVGAVVAWWARVSACTETAPTLWIVLGAG